MHLLMLFSSASILSTTSDSSGSQQEQVGLMIMFVSVLSRWITRLIHEPNSIVPSSGSVITFMIVDLVICTLNKNYLRARKNYDTCRTHFPLSKCCAGQITNGIKKGKVLKFGNSWLVRRDSQVQENSLFFRVRTKIMTLAGLTSPCRNVALVK
jgi:hypothetical protein